MSIFKTAWDFVTGAADTASKYSGLIKTGIAALSTYGAYKDQQKKNEMQQAAYDDYMRQAAAAGFEAEAAVDLNLTPMTVSGVPTTKADVTDFTAVAAKGGLMSIPNRQRKRYARGPEAVEVMEMDEEVITPLDLQQETGIDFTGEQVRAPGSASPREGAWSVWNSGAIDQEIYEFDFEIFFDSGDWSDMLKGQAPTTENMQMASHEGNDAFLENRYQELLEMNLSPAEAAAQAEKELSSGNVPGPMATGGIAGLRKGYNIGDRVEAVDQPDAAPPLKMSSQMRSLMEGNQMTEDAYTEIFTKFMNKFPNIDTDTMRIEDMIAMLQAEEVMGTEDLGILGLDRSMDMITPESVDKSVQRISMGDTQYGNVPEEIFTGYEEYNKGGRIRKANGGIMDLGGMEKDYRFSGGFVPIGAYEKKDDVPARLSKNEFVMTADAVRAAGGGSINKGAKRMYDTMKNLEARPEAKRMTA